MKIIATNAFGDSPFSPDGSGAIVKLVPDKPTGLLNDGITTNDLTIRFTWNAGASSGGIPILSYSVYYDQGLGTDAYSLLKSGITTTEY